MALIEINKNPSTRELRQFAGIWFPAFCALVGGLLWYKWDLHAAAIVLWCVGGGVAAIGLMIPALMRPIFIGWMYAAFPIGWTISHLLLAMIYYLLITPIGLVMRLVGYDPMQRELDPAAKTYWVKHKQSEDAARYFRQF